MNRSLLSRLMYAVALLMALHLSPSPLQAAHAQGSVQVNVLGVPSVLSSPFADDIARNFEQGRYPVQLTYTSPSRRAASMRLRVAIEKDGVLLAETTSEPFSLRPGVHLFRGFASSNIRFRDTMDDLIEQAGSEVRNTIVRTGALPEGAYTVTVEPLPEDPLLSALPGTASFTVRFAQPPAPLTPIDGATVAQTYPVFSWTPVTGATTNLIEYDVRLVEVLPGQTPTQALQANRPYLEETVRQTTLVYTPEALPLVPGTRYAWQLTARDASDQIPIAGEGRSEIQTFTYADPSAPGEGLASLRAIDLVPGFARLTDLDVTADERATSYALNGTATLALQFDEPVTYTVELRDLEVQKTGLDDPVLLGGGVEVVRRNLTLPVQGDAPLATLRRLQWQFGEGFVADARLHLPNGDRLKTTGSLRLTPNGLSGRLVAEDADGLVEVGEEPLSMTLTRVEARYPERTLRADGTARLFGDKTACHVRGLNLADPDAGGTVACAVTHREPLVASSDRLTLELQRLDGSFRVDLAADTYDYDVRAKTAVALTLQDDQPPCGAAGFVRLTPGTVQADAFTPNCGADGPARLPLGLFALTLEDVSVPTLAYNAGTSTWDFELALDGQLEIPALEDFATPRLDDLRLSPQGLTLPDLDFTGDELASAAPLSFGGFALSVDRLATDAFTFPWFTWNGTAAGPWSAEIDGQLQLPSGPSTPACLENATFDVQSLTIDDGTVEGALPVTAVQGCTVPLGPSAALELDHVGGTLGGTATAEALTLDSELDLDAGLALGPPFTCADAEPLDLAEAELTLTSEGLLEGTIDDLVPPCPVAIGPLTAEVNASQLTFAEDGGAQEAHLAAKATLALSPQSAVEGRFALDLTTGAFDEMRFELDEPFQWSIPADEPVLTFQIDHAIIDTDGFKVDGRQELVFGDGARVGATFDRLVLDLYTRQIRSGSIVIDSGVALEASIDPSTHDLAFAAQPAGAPLSQTPGLRVDLPGAVTVDTTGLSTTGPASARLAFGEWANGVDVTADFSSDFRLGLFPFGIERGLIDLQLNNASIAYVDADGFHPSPAAVASALPDRLPLPNENVAYLELRRNGQPLVDATPQSDGSILIETLPGETVDLVVPALQTSDGTPRIAASFTDLYVNASGSGFVYHSGTVNAQLTGAPLDLTPLGVPMELSEVAYGNAPVGNTSEPGLYLRGDLNVFDTTLGPDTEFILSVDAQGGVSGSVNLDNLDEEVVLAGGTGQVTLGLDAISGSVNGPGGTALTLGGGIAIENGGDTLGSADVSLEATPQSVSVLQFTPSGALASPSVQLGDVRVGIDEIRELKEFAYDAQNGFSFRLALDVALDLVAPDDTSFTTPLKGVEITESGLHIPAQTVNESTTPQLDVQQTLAVGPVEMRLFDLELTQPVTIDWYGAPSISGLGGLQLGIGLRVPSYAGLAEEEATLTNVSFDDGIFTGQLSPLSFVPGQEPTLPIGESGGLKLASIAGALTREMDGATPQQGFDLDLTGALELPDAFTPEDETSCSQGDITLGLSRQGGLEGTVSDFAACATMAYGPATLGFPSSTLDFAVTPEGDQTATLDGQAVAAIDDVNGNEVTATGDVTLDLITGTMTSGSIALTGAFEVGLPEDDPVFTLAVSDLTLAPSGYSITGTGDLAVGTGSVGVDFDQFTLDPQTGAVASGSMTVEGAFALEVMLQGDPGWQVVDVTSPPSTSTALRLDVPAQVTVDATGLSVDGSSTAALNYNGETYASMTADFINFGLGLAPVEVDRGRAEFTTQQGTRVAYYDTQGFHFDAAGVAVAVLPDRIPLPTEDVAYLVVKDEDGTPLVDYTEISGGYRLNSLTDDQGDPQPLELVLAGLDDQGEAPTVEVTLTDLDVNSTWQDVMNGSIVASASEDLSDALDIPLVLETVRYEEDGGTYALTVDGRVKLPDELGTPDVTFTDLGLTSDGFQGLVEAGATPFAASCGALPASYAPQSALASVAYANGGLQANPSEAQIEAADLALSLRTARLEFDPSGSDTYAIMGDVSSRITAPGKEGEDEDPTQIPFTLGYTDGTWTASLCTDPLPDDENGNDKVSILLAELYLDEDNGGSATLEIGNGEVDVTLSGTMRIPDVMGGTFDATVQDLKMGTSGISVAQAGGATSGQETLLFGDALKLRNDQLAVDWDNQVDALVLSLSGSVWLTPFMCPQGNATECIDGDAAQFADLSVDTRGNVALGSASANLLAGREDPLAVIGSNPDPTLAVDTLAIRKPQGESRIALDVGGALDLPDVAEGVASRFLFELDNQGQIAVQDALTARFVTPSGPNDQVDERGDNPDTEIDFGGVGMLDVKEAGLQFQNDQLVQPAVFANATLYLQDGTSDLVRFGPLGANTASTAGLYVGLDEGVAVNVSDINVSEIDLGGFLTISNVNVSTTQDAQRGPQFAIDGTVGVALEGVSGSGNWNDFTIDRQGIASWGQPGGNLDLSVVEVVSLSIGTIDAGSGSVNVPGQGTVDADSYFTLTNANIDLQDAIQGGVDGVHYYKAGDDVFFKVDNAYLTIESTIDANMSFTYENNQGQVLLSAAGSAEMQGTGSLTVAGQVGKRVLQNGDVVSSFGFFASASANIPILPGLISISDIGGGFFRYPTADMLQTVRDQMDAFELVDQVNETLGTTDFSSTEDINFAVYLQGGAGIISAPGTDAYMMSGQLVLELRDGSFTMVAMVDEMYGMKDRIRAGMVLAIKYDPGSVEGGFVVDVDFPGIIEGTSVIAFQAYEQENDIVWAVMGDIGPYDILSGVGSANGSFLASNDGMLLRELTVDVGTPKIYIIEIKASATISFWYVPDDALGAYGELSVEASLLGGLAEAGANLKGAYIQNEDLIYLAADAYVSVAFVFEGSIGVWVSMEKGNLRGGKGNNPRYEDMIADAQQEAEDMIARADEAAAALEEAKNAPFEFDPETIRQAGLELVSASANNRDFYAESMLCNDQDLYDPNCNINNLNGRLSLLEGLADDVITSTRPGDDVSTASHHQTIQDELQELQQKATAIEQYLNDLQAQAVEWNAETADMLESMTLQSPISQFQEATYTGSGENRRLTASPSFTVDTTQNNAQADELSQLKQNIDALDAQYRASIAAASQNLNQISDLMSGSVVFDESSWISYSTTINGVAKDYADLTTDIRRLFATRADSLWSNYDWAQDQRTKFTSGPYRRSQIESLMTQMLNDYDGSGNYVPVDVVTCNRNFWVNQLRRLGDDDYSHQQQSQDTDDYCDTISDYRRDGNYSQLETEFENMGAVLWHDVPEEGLTAWSQRLRSEAEDHPGALQDVLAPIQSGHRALTESIDNLFLVKAEMATTLHGMIDEYVGWRRGAQGLDDDETDAVIDNHLDKKDALIDALKPPRIEQLVVGRQNSGWIGEASVFAWITHPDEVAEVSYAVGRGSNTNVYSAQDVYTMGRETSLDLYTFAETVNQETQSWNVTFRARGPAGNTITRRTSFDLAVNENGTSDAPSGLVADALVDDTSPPSRPTVSFPTMERRTTYEATASTGEATASTGTSSSSTASSSGTFSTLNLSSGSSAYTMNTSSYVNLASSSNALREVERLWTSESGQMTFVVVSSDAESDIAGYEYRLGTTPGGNEVRDWTYAPGLPLSNALGSAFSNAARKVTVHGLSLEPGQPYYLSVRSQNGADLYSTVREIDEGIMYDPTPPGATGPAANELEPGMPPSYDAQIGYTRGVVHEPPAYEGPPSTNENPVDPEITVQWTAAQDAESGIHRYRYAVTASEDTTNAFEDALHTGETTSTSVTIRNNGISFVEDRYVHVRAVNHAGAAGPIQTIGPFRPVDPTAPRTPTVKAMVMNDGIRVYLPKPSADRESGLKGYQYAIARRTASGAFNGWVRSFPTDDEVDFQPPCTSGSTSSSGGLYMAYTPVYTLSGVTPSSGSSSGPAPTGCSPEYSGSTAPYVFIPSDGLPTGESLYVYIRGINQQGYRTKRRSSTGPIVFDTSPPQKPTVDASYTPALHASGSTLTIDVSGVHDPQSGVRKIEYALKSDGEVGTWHEYATISGLPTSPQSFSRSFAGPSSPGNEIGIRITNGSGVQRVSWQCMSNALLAKDTCSSPWTMGGTITTEPTLAEPTIDTSSPSNTFNLFGN